MTDTATPSTATDEGHDEHEAHGASDRTFVLLALFLAVVTAVEVAFSYVDVGPVMIPGLIIMMIIKFGIVVSYFMHLKYERLIFKAMFYSGVGLAVSVYVLTMFTLHFFG